MTDDWPSFRGIGRGFDGGHHVVRHGAGEYARGGAHVDTAESYFALLKRGVVGALHHVSNENLHRYCDELSFRWNSRSLDDGHRPVLALRKSGGKRLTYQAPIG